jgi:hypothetical protein
MTYLPVVPNLSPALAQAIGLFEVDGMTILLQVKVVDRPPGSHQQIAEIPLDSSQGRREFAAGSGKERRSGRADPET